MTTQPIVDQVRPAPLSTVSTCLPEPLDNCAAELFDGWVLHEAALRNGLNTLLFPGQALMAYHGKDPASGLAFAHGVSNATWLSSATVVQDKRMRRDLLAAAGIPVPQARAFSLKRGTPYARDFADAIGYPVVVKPMIGESTVEVMPGIADELELHHAIEYLRTVPTNRETFTTSSYAFTQILTPRTSSSTRTRGTYRYLVEKHVFGQYVRLLVVEGQVVSAILAPEGPWRLESEIHDITAEIHTDLRTFASDVWDASPGLPVVAVDVVLQDHAAPLSANNAPVVVEHSERPWLHVQHAASARLSVELGQVLLDAAASAFGLVLPHDSRTNDVSASFRWDGLSDVDEATRIAEEVAASMQVTLSTTLADPVAGIASGYISGSSAKIALLSELLVEGDLLSQPAMAVELQLQS